MSDRLNNIFYWKKIFISICFVFDEAMEGGPEAVLTVRGLLNVRNDCTQTHQLNNIINYSLS